jgi:hypothetical protein
MLLVRYSHVKIRAKMYSNLRCFNELSHVTRKTYSSKTFQEILGPKTNRYTTLLFLQDNIKEMPYNNVPLLLLQVRPENGLLLVPQTKRWQWHCVSK